VEFTGKCLRFNWHFSHFIAKDTGQWKNEGEDILPYKKMAQAK